MPPSPMHYKFSITHFYWNKEGFHYGVFRHCEQKVLDGNKGIPPSLILNNLSNPESFWNTEVTPYEVFGPVKFSGTQKATLTETFSSVRHKFLTENWDTPYLLSINISPYQKISGTQKGTLTKIFGPVKKSCVIFFFDTKWGFPSEFLSNVRQKMFQQKIVRSSSYAEKCWIP